MIIGIVRHLMQSIKHLSSQTIRAFDYNEQTVKLNTLQNLELAFYSSNPKPKYFRYKKKKNNVTGMKTLKK